MTDFARLPGSRVYRVLEAGPTVMLTTRDEDGRPNVMTVGFHMVVDHENGLVAAVVSPGAHSHRILHATGECVLAVPAVDLAGTTVDVGNCSGSDVDKFTRYRLETQDGDEVRAPLLPACLANVECRVEDASLDAAYGGLVVLRALTVWIDGDRGERRTLHHNGDGTFHTDGDLVDLRDRMVLWKRYQD